MLNSLLSYSKNLISIEVGGYHIISLILYSVLLATFYLFIYLFICFIFFFFLFSFFDMHSSYWRLFYSKCLRNIFQELERRLNLIYVCILIMTEMVHIDTNCTFHFNVLNLNNATLLSSNHFHPSIYI